MHLIDTSCAAPAHGALEVMGPHGRCRPVRRVLARLGVADDVKRAWGGVAEMGAHVAVAMLPSGDYIGSPHCGKVWSL